MASILKLSSDGETFHQQDCARFCVQAPFHRWTDQGLAEIGRIEIQQYENLVSLEVNALLEHLQRMDEVLRTGNGMPRKLGKRSLPLLGEGPQSHVHIARPFVPEDPNQRSLRVETEWNPICSQSIVLPVSKVPLLRKASEGVLKRKDLIFIANRLGIASKAGLQ